LPVGASIVISAAVFLSVFAGLLVDVAGVLWLHPVTTNPNANTNNIIVAIFMLFISPLLLITLTLI